MIKENKDMLEARRLMNEKPNFQPDKPTLLGTNENYKFIQIPGKHGRICVLVPICKPTSEEWHSFNVSMAEIIYKIQLESNKPLLLD